MTTSASWSSPTPAAPGAAITPISPAGTSASASIICWSPAGAPTRRSRVWGVPTAPTRNSRRCSGRSRPTSRARSAFCRRSRAVSTPSAPSPAASARPAARDCSVADDNLESAYAKAALRQFYQLLHAGKIDGCSLSEFQETTGLDLCDQDGSLREELPPITQFLNRVLALRIAMQNLLFAAFEQLLDARIEAAIASGIYDVGVETLTAESFRIAERRTVCTYAATGSETRCYRVLRKDRNRPLPLEEALALRAQGGRLLINDQSRHAAVQMHAPSLMDDDGKVQIRTRLIRPMSRETLGVERFEHSHWRKATREEFTALWEAECASVPEFTESAFHIITGLLLPVWDRLPVENMRVYRFETDDGERVIGRLVTPEALGSFLSSAWRRRRARSIAR